MGNFKVISMLLSSHYQGSGQTDLGKLSSLSIRVLGWGSRSDFQAKVRTCVRIPGPEWGSEPKLMPADHWSWCQEQRSRVSDCCLDTSWYAHGLICGQGVNWEPPWQLPIRFLRQNFWTSADLLGATGLELPLSDCVKVSITWWVCCPGCKSCQSLYIGPDTASSCVLQIPTDFSGR